MLNYANTKYEKNVSMMLHYHGCMTSARSNYHAHISRVCLVFVIQNNV